METLIQLLNTAEAGFFATCVLACLAYVLGTIVGATGVRRESRKRPETVTFRRR